MMAEMSGGPGAGMPRVSLIIPAYNEERFLAPLLDSVDAARMAYSAGRDAVEVIVVDNASTDRTAQLAATRGCRVVRVEQRVIAAARNGGARAARGRVLAFVDADTVLHLQTFNAIEEALAGGRVVAGATGLTMERWSPGIALTYALLVPLVWLTGMDSGVVFCRRGDFETVGGYDERRLYAEDVALLLALRRLGRSRGQHLARLRRAKAIGSARKFDDFGDWHYLTMVPKFCVRVLLGRADARDFARLYWYEPRR